ncbi:MAG: hypothetical protein RJB34_1271 [Pseudomonadota bacterium]|jgi:dTDP-4-dehydrorhamnose 3,5-epimerase/CDP-3, 6-dideoxy-D-glycero-D-glycero-4-hexulose-5-epimerase
MEIEKELLPDTWLINLKKLNDLRGCFVKTYVKSWVRAINIGDQNEFEFAEEYYSISKKNVLRGMHFQTPPHQHKKLVFCAAGAVEDVVVDLRKGGNYGKYCRVTLDSSTPKLLMIPAGVAHGFLSLSDTSIMIYKTSTEYAPENDKGVLYNSFGFKWASENPIISERDMKHIDFPSFDSPF